MLRDPELARDAAQEAALQALLSLDRLRHGERFGSWLAGIGLNICRGWLRERLRESWSFEAVRGGLRVPERVDRLGDPAALAEAGELAVRVRLAVDGLPRAQRAAVLLFYLGGLTHAETAAELGIEVNAVKARLHRARTALKDQLWNVWMEETMSPGAASDARLVEMRVTDVRQILTDTGKPSQHVVVLEDSGRTRSLLIWVGPFEGAALAWQLEKIQASRPLTFAFMASLLEATGGRLREVRISRLVEETFYAEAVIEGPSGPVTVDARPSDALNLALMVGAPITVESAVLEAEACAPPDERQPRSLPDVRARSVGPAEIVAQARAGWIREATATEVDRPPAEPPPA